MKTGSAKVDQAEALELPVLGTWDHDLRLELLPFVPDVVVNLLPVGVTVLYAEPGLGKSMLSQAVEHYVAYGRPFGHWPESEPSRCLVIDLEGDPALTQERGFSMTPWGMLETDTDEGRPLGDWMGRGGIFHLRSHATGDFGIDGKTIGERYLELDAILTESAEKGYPWRYVRIDTMRDFVGSKPADTNAYDWDKKWVTELNRLAKHHGCAFLLIHHTNKAGEISGSQGISAAGECTISLKRNPEQDGECILKSEKTRRGAPFEYAMRMNSEGVWQFDPDTSVTQVANKGLCRKIVDIIHQQGPKTFSELKRTLYDAAANAVKAALHRLAGRREARYYHGAWELTVKNNADLAKIGPRMAFCSVCNERMTVIGDATAHPGCVPPAADDEELPEPDEETGTWSGSRSLKDSIAGSKFFSVPCIRKAERGQLPWPLITEQMDGHFRPAWHRTDLAIGPADRIVILDRNGSYPSVGNSVPVAANVLKHSGAISERGRTAGIYLIDRPAWDRTDMPHPLGATADTSDRPDGRIWITTPHLIKLERLAAQGHLRRPDIWDSWTAPVTWSLFEAFAQEVKAQRAATYDPQQPGGGLEYVRVKRSSSVAIRGVWPKKTNSPHWRPDWHQSWEGESAVRHWSATFNAVQARKASDAVAWEVLKMGNTDELVLLVRDGASVPDLATWAPPPAVAGEKAPITLGPEYGQYKHLQRVLLTDGTRVPSPLTPQQWAMVRGNR
jgi:hypothetical protein